MTPLALSLALGAPLVHDGGDVSAMLAQAAAHTREALEPTTLQSIQELPPRATPGAVVRRCTRERGTLAEVRADLVRAEAALGTADLAGVADHLDLAVARMGCLVEVVDPVVAGKVFLLRGALAAELGRADDARAELHTSLSFHPEVAWPSSYPSAGAPVLATVAALPDRHTLMVVPSATSGPWVDGHDLPDAGVVELRPGLHLAQHSARAGLSTAWLVVGADATWVLPDTLLPSTLDRFSRGEHEPTATVLRILYPQGAWVAHQGGLWEIGPTEVVERVPAFVPDDDPKKGRKRR